MSSLLFTHRHCLKTIRWTVAALLSGVACTVSAQDFLANKKFSPTDIAANSQSSLTFDLFNTSGVALAATVADTLPVTTPPGQLWFSAADLASATVTGQGCTTGTLALSGFFDMPTNSRAQTLTISGANVPYVAGSQEAVCQVTIPVHSGTVAQDSNMINSVPQGGAFAMEGQNRLESDPFSATLRVRAPVNPFAVGKSFAPATIPAGGQTKLTITVKNNESSAKSNVRFTDNLPLGLTALGAPVFSPSCGPAQTSTVAGSASVVMSGAAIAAGATCSVTVMVEASAAVTGPLVNTIPAGGVSDGSSSNAVPAQSTVTVRNQIKMTKAFMAGSNPKTNQLPDPGNLYGTTFSTGAASAVIGQAVPVRVYFSNPTSNILTSGSLTDDLPDDVVGVAGEVGGTCGLPSPRPTVAAGADPVTISGFTVPAADLAAGTLGTCYVEFWVKATAAFANTTNALNTTNISFDGIDSGDIDAATSADLAVPAPGTGGALTVSKTFFNEARTTSHTGTTGGLQVAKGEEFWMRVNVYNRVYDTTYTGVTVSDLLPLGVKAVMPLNTSIQAPPGGASASQSCAVNGTLNVADDGGRDRVTFTGASVPGAVGAAATDSSKNQGCFYWIKLVSNQAGGYQNTIPANSVTSAQGISNPSSANARVAVASELTTTKSFSPAQIGPNGGGRTRLILRFENSGGTSAITGLGVTDNLPGSAQFGYLNNAMVASNTCGGTVTVTPGGAGASDSVVLAGGTVAAGGSCQIEVDVTHSGGVVTNFGTVTNTIPANAVTNDQGQTNPLDITADLAKANMGISLVKSFPSSSAFGGRSVPLTLHFAATSGSVQPQGNITVADHLPAGMQVAPTPNMRTTCKKADGITNPDLTIDPDRSAFVISGFYFSAYGGGRDSCDVTVDMILTETGNKVNNIPAGAISTDAGTSNPAATEASLSALVNTAVQKDFNPKTIKANQTSTLTLTIVHVGTAPRIDFTLTDTFPAGLIVASAPAVTTTCGDGTVTAVAGSNSVSIVGGDLAPNSTCTISVNVTSKKAGSYVNNSSNFSGSDYIDTSPANDTLDVEKGDPLPPTPVPSLSELALLVLGLLMAVLAWRQRHFR